MRISREAIILTLVAAGCTGPGEPPPPAGPVPPTPSAENVEAVLFLAGDAGVAELGRSPLLLRLAREVDRWSGALSEGSVAVAFLGDNVYPVGVHPREDPSFRQDSVRLWSQVDVVASPLAVSKGTLGLFAPGNHDWGNMIGEEGQARLANQGRMLARARERSGVGVELVPPSGEPGPTVRDVGRRVRLIVVDTHWLLQTSPGDWEPEFFSRIAQAIRGAGGRDVILLAHHPLRSAGPHGALVPALEAMGLLYLFKKSGAFIQDLNSPVYAAFRERLREAFAEGGGPPMVVAGGHDHSLQVLSPIEDGDPPHMLVSGAGSKLTDVSNVPGLRMGISRPGFMALYFLENGDVELRVHAGSPGDQHCAPDDEPGNPELLACMERSASRFEPIYGETLARSGAR